MTVLIEKPAINLREELNALRAKVSNDTVLLDFNVVENSKFSKDTAGWTDSSTGTGSIAWNAAGSIDLTSANSSNRGSISQAISLTKGDSLVISLTKGDATDVYMYVGSAPFNAADLNTGIITGSGSFNFTAAASGNRYITIFGVSGPSVANIDNVFLRKSTNSLQTGFKPNKVWVAGVLQSEGTDYDVTYDGFIYGISFFIEPATNVQVEGVQS